MLQFLKAATAVATTVIAVQIQDMTSPEEARKQIAKGLKSAAAYHRISKKQIKQEKKKLEDELSDESSDSEDSSQSLNEANARLVLGTDCKLNKLPHKLGKLGPSEISTRIFSLYCDMQEDESTCGWRALLYAYFLEELTSNNKRISNEALKECINDPDLPHIERIPHTRSFSKIKREAIKQNGSDIFVSKINACIEFMKNWYDLPRFQKYVAPGIGQLAEDYHLRHMAEILPVQNFHIVELLNGGINLAPPHQAEMEFEKLRKIAKDRRAYEDWKADYWKSFEKQREEIMSNCTREQLKRFIKHYNDGRLFSGLQSSQEKLAMIFRSEREKRGRALRRFEQDLEEGGESVSNPCDNQYSQVLENEIRENFHRDFVKPNKTGNLHFACHIPNHWFLITVRKEGAKGKEEGKGPVILELDSMNYDLNDYPEKRELISYIYDVFVKPFEPKKK